MNEFVSIIIPVRERAKKSLECINLIRKNTLYKPYEIIVVADSDDNKILLSKEKLGDVRWKVMKERNGYIRKVNAGFEIAKGKYLQVFGDDVEVQENWLRNAIECFKKSFSDGIGVVCFNDGEYCDKLAIHPFLSRKWVDTYQYGKWLQQPEYIHYHGDMELTLIAKNMKKFVYCPKAIALHIREKEFQKRDSLWWYGYMNFWKRDSSIFEARSKGGFPGYGPKKVSVGKVKVI